MRKWMGMILSVTAAVLLVLAISCTPADTSTDSYAEDRALIENLQARYMFAMNSFDLDTYVSTFTEDGILNENRKSIRTVTMKMNWSR